MSKASIYTLAPIIRQSPEMLTTPTATCICLKKVYLGTKFPSETYAMGF